MIIKKPTLLKDTLNNWTPTSGANYEYCEGIAVGVVGALMACGMSFEDAIAQVAIFMPKDTRLPVPVPPTWLAPLAAAKRAKRVFT